MEEWRGTERQEEEWEWCYWTGW